jgi:hypothetical protein
MIKYLDIKGGIICLEIPGGLKEIDLTKYGPMTKKQAMAHAWKTWED